MKPVLMADTRIDSARDFNIIRRKEAKRSLVQGEEECSKIFAINFRAI